MFLPVPMVHTLETLYHVAWCFNAGHVTPLCRQPCLIDAVHNAVHIRSVGMVAGFCTTELLCCCLLAPVLVSADMPADLLLGMHKLQFATCCYCNTLGPASWVCSQQSESALLCRWYYAKGIDTDEAYVFVCYDSRDGRARFTPHTGFKDPTTSSDAPHRQSVETRAFVFWEHEPEQDIAQTL